MPAPIGGLSRGAHCHGGTESDAATDRVGPGRQRRLKEFDGERRLRGAGKVLGKVGGSDVCWWDVR